MLLLSPFLQASFRVAWTRRLPGRLLYRVAQRAQDEGASGFDAAVEVNRTDEGFEGVFEHTGTGFRVVLPLGVTDLQDGADAECAGMRGECLAID